MQAATTTIRDFASTKQPIHPAIPTMTCDRATAILEESMRLALLREYRMLSYQHHQQRIGRQTRTTTMSTPLQRYCARPDTTGWIINSRCREACQRMDQNPPRKSSRVLPQPHLPDHRRTKSSVTCSSTLCQPPGLHATGSGVLVKSSILSSASRFLMISRTMRYGRGLPCRGCCRRGFSCRDMDALEVYACDDEGRPMQSETAILMGPTK